MALIAVASLLPQAAPMSTGGGRPAELGKTPDTKEVSQKPRILIALTSHDIEGHDR